MSQELYTTDELRAIRDFFGVIESEDNPLLQEIRVIDPETYETIITQWAPYFLGVIDTLSDIEEQPRARISLRINHDMGQQINPQSYVSVASQQLYEEAKKYIPEHLTSEISPFNLVAQIGAGVILAMEESQKASK